MEAREGFVKEREENQERGRKKKAQKHHDSGEIGESIASPARTKP